MNELRDPEGKLSGSDTGTCCQLAAPSEAPQPSTQTHISILKWMDTSFVCVSVEVCV